MAKRKLTIKRKTAPYSEATDDEKIVRNWKKTLGLFERGEYSAAILRAAISIELTVNYAIRQELVETKGLPLDFVNQLLKDANGIHRKFTGIFLPIMKEYNEYEELQELFKKSIQKVNARRNKIAHGGEFDNQKRVYGIVEEAHFAISEILDIFGSSHTINKPGD